MTETLSYSQWIDYLFAKSTQPGLPLSGTFELTARCNLDCRMCYIHKRENDAAAARKELSAGEWLKLARAAQERQMLLLLLTGGEPLLRPDFREIYKGCQDLGFLLSINTNGSLLDEKMVDFFRENPPLRVNITLYGASPETYGRLCGDPSVCGRAYRAVLALKEAGIRVKLNYSATPWNVQDLPAVYEFARANKLLIQTASYMFPPVRARERGNAYGVARQRFQEPGCDTACQSSQELECEAARLTPQEAGQVRWEYEIYRYEKEKLKERTERMLAGLAVREMEECQEFPTERIRCRAGATTFWITYDGQMRPCGMMSQPTVDVREKGFGPAWDYIRGEREKILLPARCTACKWKEVCEFCPAVTYAETGKFTGVPDYLCDKTQAFLQAGAQWLDQERKAEKRE